MRELEDIYAEAYVDSIERIDTGIIRCLDMFQAGFLV
jgi:hypothetical protein